MDITESTETIKTRSRSTCFICGSLGLLLYKDLKDKIFDTPGNWGILYCPICKLAWLNPQPVPEEINRVYNFYYTHEASRIRKLISPQNPLRTFILAKHYGYKELGRGLKPEIRHKILGLFPLFREIIGMSILKLSSDQRGDLLDVGCGSGQFLFTMKGLGWNVKGIEIDAKAAAIARNEYGLDVSVGNLEEANFSNASFDIIVLNHVIEHVYNPIQLLIECRRILKPTGKLILTTPNLESLGHTLFQGDWRGLEIPRHLMVFSLSSVELCTLKAGFRTIVLRGSTRLTRDIYLVSKMIRKNRKEADISKLSYNIYSMEGWLFQFIEETIRPYFRSVPDEIYYVGERME